MRESEQERRSQPLTAPAVRPAAMFFWIIRKKITTGSEVMTAPAMSGPQKVCRVGLVVAAARPSGSGSPGLFSVLMMMNSFHAWMKP